LTQAKHINRKLPVIAGQWITSMYNHLTNVSWNMLNYKTGTDSWTDKRTDRHMDKRQTDRRTDGRREL